MFKLHIIAEVLWQVALGEINLSNMVSGLFLTRQQNVDFDGLMQNRCIDVTIMHWRYVSFALSHLSGLSSNFIYILIMQDIVTSWWRYETVMFFILLAKVDLLSPMESLYKEAVVLIFDVYFVGNPNIIFKKTQSSCQWLRTSWC